MSRSPSPTGPLDAPTGVAWLAGAPGMPCETLVQRLGPPAADRTAGGGRWLAWRWRDLDLRVRGGAGAEGRVTAWTARFRVPRRSLRAATEPFGLWPACAPEPPDAAGGAGAEGRLRRAVRPGGGPARSLTAEVVRGGIAAVTLFDEPPDWE